MKMRLVSLLLVLVMVTAVLVGCSTTTEASEPNPFEGRFVGLYAGDGMYVITDKMTGVCYLWRGVGNRGGLTVMMNTDGTPMTWEERK